MFILLGTLIFYCRDENFTLALSPCSVMLQIMYDLKMYPCFYNGLGVYSKDEYLIESKNSSSSQDHFDQHFQVFALAIHPVSYLNVHEEEYGEPQ